MPFSEKIKEHRPNSFINSILKYLIKGIPFDQKSLPNNNNDFKQLWSDFLYNVPCCNNVNKNQLQMLEKSVNVQLPITCLQGAAGTGKTEILAISALLWAYKKSKMLICVATNEAADNITKRILKIYPDACYFVLRYYSRNYSLNDIDLELQSISNMGANNVNMKDVRILISTVGLGNHSKIISSYSPNCLCLEESSLILLTDFLALINETAQYASKIIIAGDEHQLQADIILPTVPAPFAPMNFVENKIKNCIDINRIKPMKINIQSLALRNLSSDFIIQLNVKQFFFIF